ncbi:MAG: hypothetical protein K0R39_1689 [Symbiobacteriaceae bacterium]|jgi:phage tail-like protein|nr:hypothetical protein [Symbiobacteriaceae bacterium]
MKERYGQFHLLLSDHWHLLTEGPVVRSSDSSALTLEPLPEVMGRDGCQGRRGVACDGQGRFYWIDDSGAGIWTAGPDGTGRRRFWPGPAPAAGSGPAPGPGGAFAGRTPPPAAPRLQGLAATGAGLLAAGLLGENALLVFDLGAGSPPYRLAWPRPIDPIDLRPAPGGGLLLLEGRQRPRVWQLDRDLRIVGRPVRLPASPEPLAIEALPDGTWLLLAGGSLTRCRGGDPIGEPFAVGLSIMADWRTGRPPEPYDIAYEPASGRLYVATRHEAQCFAFDLPLVGDHLAAAPLRTNLPTPASRGRGILAARGQIWHDADDAWRPLAGRPASRFRTEGVTRTPSESPLDGKERDCVWHRLLIDATIPPGTEIIIETRADNDTYLLDQLPWRREPKPVLRPAWAGRLVPQVGPARPPGAGTWDVLLQRAQGRYLQIRLTLIGDGSATPQVEAVRAYYPRYSYLTHHLPAVYHNDSDSASFLERYLANAEGILTGIGSQMRSAHLLFHPDATPPEYLSWLAGWFGLGLDDRWEERRIRLLIRHAMQLFRFRGTVPGLVWAIRLGVDPDPQDAIFTDPIDAYVEHLAAGARVRPGFRIAEDRRNHSFTVYLDQTLIGLSDLVDMVVSMSRPAHVSYQILPMPVGFAVDRVRLGLDSVPAAGPARLPEARLGESRLAGAVLGARPYGLPAGQPAVGFDRIEEGESDA